MVTARDDRFVGKAWIKSLGFKALDCPMSAKIEEWRHWYEASGDYWDGTDEDSQGNTFKVHRLSVHPAEMVCEDWASLLFNEDPDSGCIATVGDTEGGYEAANEALSEWLRDTDFAHRGRELVEDAMWSGTAAWELRLEGVPEDGSADAGVKVAFARHDARHIIPLTYDGDDCTECAFTSGVTVGGEPYTQVTVHRAAEGGGREVLTAFFGEKGEQVALPGYSSRVAIPGASVPTFAIVRPDIKNTYWPFSPFGVAVFDRAMGTVALADDAVDNMHRDIYLGQKMLGIPEHLLRREADGTYTVPRAKDQQLFLTLSDGSNVYDRGGLGVVEYNPDLRMSDNRLALKTALEVLGMRCGLGRDYYGLDETGRSVVKTATEVASSERTLLRNAEKHKHSIEAGVRRICESALELMRLLQGLAIPDCTGRVRVHLADAIIEDDATERDRDLKDVAAGVMSGWEYRAKWYGESEDEARAGAAEASEAGLLGAPLV